MLFFFDWFDRLPVILHFTGTLHVHDIIIHTCTRLKPNQRVHTCVQAQQYNKYVYYIIYVCMYDGTHMSSCVVRATADAPRPYARPYAP